MKTVTMYSKGLMLLLAAGLLFTACKKEGSQTSEAELEATVESSLNDSEADLVYDDVFNTSMGIGAETGEDLGWTAGVGIYSRSEADGLGGRIDSARRCFTITVVPQTRGVFPKTVTIDFGAGCTGRDGVTRKGKVITVYSGPMRIPGSKATTTFERFKVDSVAVEGTYEVINNSTSNNRILTTRIIAGKLTWDSGRWVRWSNSRTVTQIEGNGTPFFPIDDVYQITGAGRGESSRGKSWAHEVVEPLIKKFTCRWISKGIVRIRVNNTVGTLNYGDGSCDNKATITVNGNVREITLR